MKANYVILLPFFLWGCLSEYIPKDVEIASKILVVDGMITDGESVFILRKSVGITEHLYDEELVDNAILHVECSDGTKIPGQLTGSGTYIVLTGELNPQMEYRLNFSIDQDMYQSDFLTPIIAPEIDTLIYELTDDSKSIVIYVSSLDSNNEFPYFRWTFKETWEVRSQLYANAGYMDGVLVPFHLFTPQNTYYCWGSNKSSSLLLETTEKLSENMAYKKKLIEIPLTDEKLSILYHISVEQTQMRKEAYKYLSVLRNTAERSGGLFSPVLSAGEDGNIRCLTDSNLPVIGYVEVSTSQMKELYISIPELFIPTHLFCDIITYFEVTGGHLPYEYPQTYALPNCVDCRRKKNASKNKPEWWPTDHL